MPQPKPMLKSAGPKAVGLTTKVYEKEQRG